MVAFAGLYFLQYLAVSNTGACVYTYVSDTVPYSDVFSYVPLPRGLILAVYPFVRLLKFPLQQLLLWATAEPIAPWSRSLITLLTPFGSASEHAVKKNHFVIAAADTLIWAGCAAVLWGASRRFRRRPAATSTTRV